MLLVRGARSARADTRLCTSSGINLAYSASVFSPGEVGDCTKHWQRKSGRQATRANVHAVADGVPHLCEIYCFIIKYIIRVIELFLFRPTT